jgi:hypothetical protein
MNIKVDTTTEHIESKGGLLLAGQLAAKMGIPEIESKSQKDAGKILMHFLGMLVQGKSDFEAIKEFRDNEFFKEAMGLDRVLSADTVRLYMEEPAKDTSPVVKQLQGCSNRLLSKTTPQTIHAGKRDYIPVDIDTSPMDNSNTKKENIGYTYKGFVGYHPIFAYMGLEGYMLSCEMRPGTQHCQKGTPEFIRNLMAPLHDSTRGNYFLFRLDSGNDSLSTIESLLRDREGKGIAGNYFIMKRNLRQESSEWWEEEAKAEGKCEKMREGKKRYIGTTAIESKVTEKFPGVRVVYEVIERTCDRQGEQYLLPRIEVNTFWTNLSLSAREVIELYHEHGTMEQFHAELKSEVGLERFPSGKYDVNRILLALGMAAFNLLRFMGQSALAQEDCLPEKTGVKRKRIGKVITDLVCIAGKVIRHAGGMIIKIWENNPWYPVYERLYIAFQTL